jgi:hypothetical protein
VPNPDTVPSLRVIAVVTATWSQMTCAGAVVQKQTSQLASARPTPTDSSTRVSDAVSLLEHLSGGYAG